MLNIYRFLGKFASFRSFGLYILFQIVMAATGFSQYDYSCGRNLVRLDGTKSYMFVEYPQINSQDFFYAFWMRIDDLSTGRDMGLIYRSNRSCFNGLVFTSTGELKFEAHVDATPRCCVYSDTYTSLQPAIKKDSVETSGLQLEKGKFYHIACSYNDQTQDVIIYVNGQVKASKKLLGKIRTTFLYANNPVFAVGAKLSYWDNFSYFGHFKGYLDDVLINSFPIDPSQIDSIANGKMTPDYMIRHRILGYWTLEEGSGVISKNQGPFTSTRDDRMFLNSVIWVNFKCPTSNKPPVANAGPDLAITAPPGIVTLDGKLSTDEDGTIASYQWRLVSGPNSPVITGPNASSSNVSGLIEGDYFFRLTVTDDKGATGVDDVKITVTKVNQPPQANAGPDQEITLPIDFTTLNGTSSSDPDGSIATYQWGLVSGPNSPVITSPNTSSSNVSGLIEGDYFFRLTVTDDKGATGVDDVKITVGKDGVILLLDPYSLVKDDGSLKNDITAIDKSKVVIGLATDSVAKIILLVESKSDINFSILNYGDQSGHLSEFSNQSGKKNVVSAVSVNGRSAVIFNSPDGFGENFSVKDGRFVEVVGIEKDNPNKKYRCKIKLVTPPVVMVHGMWSSSKVWEKPDFLDNPKSYLLNNPFLNSFNATLTETEGFSNIAFADYSPDASKTFDPKNPESLPARRSILAAILMAIDKYRDLGIVSSQVDIVAHSLGGLQTRSFAQWYHNDLKTTEDYFKRSFAKGFIHKLITLGTPHVGSPLGPILYGKTEEILSLRSVYGNQLYIFAPLQTLWNKITGMPIGSCHRDFNPDVSKNEALRNLGETYGIGIKKVHAIVGNHSSLGDIVPLPVPFERFIKLLAYTTLPQLFNDENDMVVARKSQIGGLQDVNSISEFNSTAHSSPPGLGFWRYRTETWNPDIYSRVSQLLRTDKRDLFGPGFRAPEVVFRETIARNNRTGAQKFTVSNKLIEISESSRNIDVLPKDSVLKISFIPINGAVVENAVAIVKKFGFYAFPDKPPYVVEIPIPKGSAVAGRFPFLVVAREQSGQLVGDTSGFTIPFKGNLLDISARPGEVIFDSLYKQTTIYATARYVMGTDTLEYLLDRTHGLDFSNNSNVYSIDSVGNIQAMGVGVDSVKVSCNGKAVFVRVRVADNFARGSKILNQIVFNPGDKEEGDGPYVLGATASSGSKVELTLINGPVEFNNNVVQIKRAGRVTIKARSSGDGYFLDAPEVVKSFCINPYSPNPLKGDSIVCSGQSIYILKKDSTTNYSWDITGGSLAKQVGDSVFIEWKEVGTQRIEVTANVEGCLSKSRIMDITVRPSVKPVISTQASFSICKDSSINLSADIPGPLQWFRNDSLLTSSTTNVIKIEDGGKYYVKAVTGSGCTTASDIVQVNSIAVPNTPVITVSGSTSFCTGGNTELKTNASGKLEWFRNDTIMSGVNQSSILISSGGKYAVRVNNGCPSAMSSPIDIVVQNTPLAPQITSSGNNRFCQGDSVLLQSSNILQNQWYKDGVLIPGQTAQNLIVKLPGQYQVRNTVTGCPEAASENLKLEVENLPKGELKAKNSIICTGSTVEIIASGGNSYKWYLDNQILAGKTESVLNAELKGVYSADVISPSGCKSKAVNVVKLELPEKPIAAFNPPVLCVDQLGDFQNTSISKGDTKWLWEFGDGNFSNEKSPQYAFKKFGEFNITLIASSMACPLIADTFRRKVTVSKKETSIRYPVIYLSTGTQQELKARSIGTSYSWQPPVGLSNPKIQNPILTASTEKDYQVTITTTNGCKVVDSVKVMISDNGGVFVPKAFTPDGNGVNDFLRPLLVNIPVMNYFKVYNRWGQVVFETKTLNNGWDGTLRGQPQPTETYTWLFEGVDKDGKKLRVSGKALLVR